MGTSDAPGRQGLRGFDSFTVGETGDLGSVVLDKDAIIAFASDWDPQPFHLDEAAGRASPLGGLAASGWHTASLTMRLLADNLLAGSRSMGSGRVRDLKWIRPVLAGDTIRARYEVKEVRASGRGDRGYVEAAFTAENQRGEPVLSMAATLIIGA